jgi:hypothetical protein
VQIGAENQNKVRAAIALVVVAAILIAYQFLRPSSTPIASSSVAPAVLPRPAQRRSSGRGKITVPAEPRLDPTLDLTTLAATEQMKYAGNGRNIFVAGADIPQPIKNGTLDHKAAQLPPQPALPPPPPPITLKFFGFASKPGEPRKVFLSQGEDVFIAAEGDIVNRRYKVLHIGPNAVDIEDVLYNNRQSIPLTQG